MLALCACNSGIFVEDFTPDVNDIVMDGAGDVRTIHFKSSDWSSLELNGSNGLPVTVTPLGGEMSSGNRLDGDGEIAVKTPFMDIAVTRRGSDVTVDVRYAIGNDYLMLWLTALSSDSNDSHVITVNIGRAEDLEIESVDYILDSWYTEADPEYRYLGAMTLSADAKESVVWNPQLTQGIVSFYAMSTASWETDELLRALGGVKIPVPTLTDADRWDWELRGDEAGIAAGISSTRLYHYPPLPSVTLGPGQNVVLVAQMYQCGFSFSLKVRNKLTGTEHELDGLLTIEQPLNYVTIDRGDEE